MSENCARPWKNLALGLQLKLLAMWLIFPAIALVFLWPTNVGLLLSALVPLSFDLVGRCLCAAAPVAAKLPIRLSIGAQCVGILGLLLLALTGLGGVVLGVVLAIILQASAAKWFIKHLQAIANTLGRPELEGDLEQLRQRLVMTTLSAYSSGAITTVVLTVAIVFGLAAYVIGLMFTLPIAFMIIAPLWVTSSVLYFLMLFSYERSLSSLRQAVRLQAGLSRD